MDEVVKCPCCNLRVFTDKEVKVWTLLFTRYYHNRCLEEALSESFKYRQVKEVVNPMPARYTLCVSDVWHCNKCGGYSGGYGRETCYHCGSKVHYSSGNGEYTLSDRLE